MSDPKFPNPTDPKAGLTLAGGAKPRLRVYRGRFPTEQEDPKFRGRSGDYFWDENNKLLGGNFNADEWEEVGTAAWNRGKDNKWSLGLTLKNKGNTVGYGTEEFDAGQNQSLLWGAVNPLDELTPEQKAFYGHTPSGGPVKPAANNGKTPAAPITPADVKANAGMSTQTPVQQKSIAEQQADYIRSRGRRTAAEADAEFESNLRKDYSEATGFDIDTAEGRRKSFQAALQRGGHADAMARNLRAGKYSYLDSDAFIPETVGVKGKGAVTYGERARSKHFATPEPNKDGPYILKGGDWVGNNVVTGEFKDREGNIWGNEGQFRNSQRGESGMVETDGMPEWMSPSLKYQTPPDELATNQAQAYANNAIADALRRQQLDAENARKRAGAENYANLSAALAGKIKSERAAKGRTSAIGPDGAKTEISVEPDFTTEDYIRQGINMEEQGRKSQIPQGFPDFQSLRRATRNFNMANNWKSSTTGPTNYSGVSDLVRLMPQFSEPRRVGAFGGGPIRVPNFRPEFPRMTDNLIKNNPFK